MTVSSTSTAAQRARLDRPVEQRLDLLPRARQLAVAPLPARHRLDGLDECRGQEGAMRWVSGIEKRTW